MSKFRASAKKRSVYESYFLACTGKQSVYQESLYSLFHFAGKSLYSVIWITASVLKVQTVCYWDFGNWAHSLFGNILRIQVNNSKKTA